MGLLEILAVCAVILAICAVIALIVVHITTPHGYNNTERRYKKANSQLRKVCFKATTDILREAARHNYSGGNHRL